MTDILFSLEVDDDSIDVALDMSEVDVALVDSDVIVVTLEGPQGDQGPPGDGTPIAGEVLTGIDGSNTIFTTAHHFLPSTTAVYLNGMREFFYDETDVNRITIHDAPLPGDTLHIDYVIKDGN